MTVYVALLRGVNVRGSHSLPMHGLRNLLARIGCEDVQTYVQSGNAVSGCGGHTQVLACLFFYRHGG